MNKNPKYEHLSVHKWKPGQSGNKGGRPRSYLTVLKELGYTKPVIATMTAEIMFMSMEEVSNLISYKYNRQEPVIKVAIARAFEKAAYHGEYKYIEPLMKILWSRQLPYMPEADNSDNKNGTLSDGNGQPDKLDE